MQHQTYKTIIEAGGLVQKTTDYGTQIAIVHRQRYNDWVLPKGHVENNESWEQAAVREVEEETGCKARIIEIATPISYFTEDKDTKESLLKVIVFFRMTLEEEGPAPKSGEVDKVYWLAPHDAVRLLTYTEQQHLIEQSYAESERPIKHSWLRRLFKRSRTARLQRLEAAISVYSSELSTLIECQGGGKYREHALDLLQQARRALEEGKDDKGWRSLHAARRIEILDMDSDELWVEAHAIRTEANEKLKNWRKEAVNNILDFKSDQSQTLTHAQVYRARMILGEHFDNVYHKLALFASKMTFLSILLFIAIAALIVVVWLDLPSADPASALGDWKKLIVIVMLGVLGATLSVTLTVVRETGRIPQVIHHEVEALVRPLVGAASAAIVVIVLESGIIGITVLSGAYAYPFAIAAGFTERLVTRVMKGIESAAEK